MAFASNRPQVSVFPTCSVEYFSNDAAQSVIGDLPLKAVIANLQQRVVAEPKNCVWVVYEHFASVFDV